MSIITRGLLYLFLSASLWQAARAEPWTVVPNPDPQPVGNFLPDVFSEITADGYWAAGSLVVVQNQVEITTTAALIRFDVDGRQWARAFGSFGTLLKRLADGGVLAAGTGSTDAPFPLQQPVCQITRVNVDGRTQWQTVLDGGSCLGLEIDAAGEI